MIVVVEQKEIRVPDIMKKGLWIIADLVSADGSIELNNIDYVLVYPDGTEVQGTTDEQGHIEQNVTKEGDYVIRILNDFEDVEEPNEEYEEENLEKEDYISINLYDETAENPVANTKYKLECPDGTEINGTTDTNGHLEHKNMPRGEYVLIVDEMTIRIPSKREPTPYAQRLA